MIYSNFDINKKFYLDESGQWPSNLHGIYAIYSFRTNKMYVGMTRHGEGFHGRWTDHRTLLRGNKHDNIYLQHSYNKHGENDFYMVVLEICSKDDPEMQKKEYKWIEKLESMYFQKGWNIDTHDNYQQRKTSYRPNLKNREKTYEILDPNGNLIKFTGLNRFCRENGLAAPNLISLLNGKIKSLKGYKSTNLNFHEKIITYKLLSPEGKIIEFNHMRKFCKENNLHQWGISNVLLRKIPSHRGWRNIDDAKLERKLPYLIYLNKKDGWFRYVFFIKKVRFQKSFKNLGETIKACEQNLIEVGDTKRLEKFRNSVKSKDLNHLD